MITAQDPDQMNAAEKEVHRVATEIVNPEGTHHFIDTLVRVLGDRREVQLTRLIPLAAKHRDWAAYTRPVGEWLEERKETLRLS